MTIDEIKKCIKDVEAMDGAFVIASLEIAIGTIAGLSIEMEPSKRKDDLVNATITLIRVRDTSLEALEAQT